MFLAISIYHLALWVHHSKPLQHPTGLFCSLNLFSLYCLQNTHRISSSQSQLLATPVVSVTTPSLPPQGLVYSGMPTGYNTGESTPLSPATAASALPAWLILIGLVSCGERCCCSSSGRGSVCNSLFSGAVVVAEYSLSSAEISSLQGFGSPGLSLGSMSAWQQHQLGQAALSSLV